MLRICFVFVLTLLPMAVEAAEILSGPVRVVDADTWDVGGIRVRLHGIDAPELDQTCQSDDGAHWSCGVWVTNQVRDLYQDEKARCRVLDRDRYRRAVARCLVEGADAGQILVARGLAFAYRKYATVYVPQERAAVAARAGLHAGKVQAPWLFRSMSKAAQPGSDCKIKGNISARGEKIYHLPGQKFYARTRINESKGERWFCSAAAARKAGWRRARS
ncbi:thermonuclease family protein [Ruegeria sp. HKCCD8929]|uniref:thermonuclease family protein n=1 Tax=Ruegeria sp. HKCCD8929 TaxID=2683006 RepID=UPI0014877584|nr:thermonuclease family protein [Ruegeria sp. HKCCD8929]